MAKRKKRAEMGLIKPTVALTGGAVTLGLGSQVVSSVGGSTASAASSGLVAAASFMPTMGAVIGGGLTVQQLRKLEKQVKNRKK